MNDYKDPRTAERWQQALEDLHEATDGAMDAAIGTAPDFTPIEKLAYIDLTSLELSERLWGNKFSVEPQAQIGRYRVDFLISFFDEQIVVECDGHDFHERTKEQAGRDKKRDRDLQALGFKVLRFTGSEIWKSSLWMEDIATEVDAIRDRAYRRKYGGHNG